MMAGAPPAAVFGGWLLSLQATVQAGQAPALSAWTGRAWLLQAAAGRGTRPRRRPGASQPAPPAGRRRPGRRALTGLIAFLALCAAVDLVPTRAAGGVPGAVSAAAILAGLAR